MEHLLTGRASSPKIFEAVELRRRRKLVKVQAAVKCQKLRRIFALTLENSVIFDGTPKARLKWRDFGCVAVAKARWSRGVEQLAANSLAGSAMPADADDQR